MNMTFFNTIVPVLMMAAMAFFLWIWLRMPEPRSTAFRLAGLLALLALITEIAGFIMNKLYIANGLIYNFYILAEAMLILAMAAALLPRARALLGFAGLIMISAMVFFVVRSGKVHAVSMEAMLVNALLLSVVVLSVLWHLAQSTEVPLYREPAFWLFMGFLVYLGGIIPVIGLDRALKVQDWELGSRLYKIVPGLAIIRYLLGAWGCHLARTHMRRGQYTF